MTLTCRCHKTHQRCCSLCRVLLTSICPARSGGPGTGGGLESRGDLVNRGALESSGDLLNRGDLGTVGGPWSTCGLWSRGDLGKYGGPVEEDAPGSEDVLQTGVVHRRGSCPHTATSHWRTCYSPAAGPSEETRRGPGT